MHCASTEGSDMYCEEGLNFLYWYLRGVYDGQIDPTLFLFSVGTSIASKGICEVSE